MKTQLAINTLRSDYILPFSAGYELWHKGARTYSLLSCVDSGHRAAALTVKTPAEFNSETIRKHNNQHR